MHVFLDSWCLPSETCDLFPLCRLPDMVEGAHLAVDIDAF
jgi:hypothetical protein